MLQQGARKFVFLGRSGLAKISAKILVADIERAGGKASVVKGDVSLMTDVEAAIAQIKGSIGGVVQSAMALDVSKLFSSTPHSREKNTNICKCAGGSFYSDDLGALAYIHQSQSQRDLEPA
jgi:hypothetical protein